MNITLSGTKVSMDGHTLAFQKNNLVDSMVITVDTDETWQYKLDVKYPCKDSNGEELYNVIDLTRVGNTCTAILQASMLPFNGKYTMQLRGASGDKVYHTDTFDVWVKYSIDPGKVYDPVPSEFYQIEQAVTEQAANAKQSATESAESATNAAASATKAENAVVHSPIVGENGNWFIWDFEKSEYVDSGKSASTPPIAPDTAGKYLTNDGSKAEWGVMSGGTDLSLGITGAQVGQIVKITAVDDSGKPTAWKAVNDRLPSVSPAENGKALYVEQIGEFEYGYGFTDIPNIRTFIPLGITDASPGQFARIKFVDDFGQPTAWEAVDIPSGGSDISLGLTAATVGQTIKVKAVDTEGQPTAWEAVDMDSEKFPKFTKLLTHTITQDELESSPVAFVWGTAQIPNLNDFNVYVLSIARPDGIQITFSKWVRLKINNTLIGNICGTSQAAEPQYVITANRLFGVWISGSYYNPKNISIPILVPPQSSTTYQSNLPASEPVTSIGFSSYAADYGLTAGVIVEIWGGK